MKVIVTGGAGFIGSHTVVELVAAGYTPVIVDNFSNSDRKVIGRLNELTGTQLEVHEMDCADQTSFAKLLTADTFGVIHFAASKSVSESGRKPLAYYKNNLGSTLAVLGAMQERGTGCFVFSSSCTVYGQPDTLPVTERSPLKAAESVYGRTKQIAEDIINDLLASGAQLKAVTLRYFNPVGAHESASIGELPLGPPENLLPYITQTAVGLRERLTIFGADYPTSDGTCVRDYIHVVDLAKAHVRALDWVREQTGRSAFNEVFNLGTGRGTSVLEAVLAFERVTGVKLNRVIGERRAGDVIQTYADATKANEVLGWKAERNIDDALRDAYRWQLALQASRA
jgi:UDP-glucose 4-epimerase